MSAVRGCVVLIGACLIILGGLAALSGGTDLPGVPAIPFLIAGVVIVVTALVEPVYGRLTGRPPLSGEWRATDERFIDPETGRLVTVWFDPKTGERRYVDSGEPESGQ